MKYKNVHFNECFHFQTDQFDSNCQSDLLKFDEKSLAGAGRLLAE